MARQKVLIPYNFTTYDKKALDFVIKTFANKKDAEITLFSTYIPLPKIDMEASPEMRKMRSPLIYLSQEFKEKEAGLQSVKGYLLKNGFSDDQIDYMFKERKTSIADEIIATASEGQYGILVLSRQPTKTSRLFTRSVHNKVLTTLKDITICMVI